MRRNRISFYILLSFVLVFTSCLKDDDTTTVYPSDAAITSFVLGSLKQYVTTKAKNGSDSTYTKTLTGSKYKFYIDQVNRTIYNPDSLPYGTDVKRVLCTITAKNSGTIAIKKVTSDTLLYYNSNDSIDFSTPRTLKVFSLDGTNIVDYTVNVNVRKEIPDTFIWNNVSSQPFVAEAAAMKALSCGNQMFVMVSNGTSSTLYGTDETNGVEWTPMGWNINMPIPANAYENIVSKNNTLYLYCGNTILKSTDGNYWEKTANAYLSRLVAAYGNYIYALDLQGKLVASADEGATWQPETLDSDASLLPTQDLSYCIIPSAINPDTKTLLLVGNRNASHYPDDNQAHVWSKVIEGDDTDEPWMYVSTNDLYYLILPRLSSLNAVSMGKDILATGGDGFGASTVKGFSQIFYSFDGGIYWRPVSTYSLPSNFESNNAFTMATDSHDNVWMFCGGNGSVWKGHYTNSSESNPSAITR